MAKSKKQRTKAEKIADDLATLIEKEELGAPEQEEAPTPESFFGAPEESEKADAYFVRHELDQADAALLGRDIFVEAWEKCKDRGFSPYFLVKRDGVYVGKEHGKHVSWEHIRKKYGTGTFFIQAKSNIGHQVITQQTMEIGPVKLDEDDSALKEEQKPTNQPNPLDIITMMNEQQAKSEERAKADQNNMLSAMATIVSAFAPKQGQESGVTTLIMEMQRQNMEMMREMQRQNMEMFKSLSDTKHHSKNEMSALEMIKLLRDTEDRTEERTEKFYKLIEERASEASGTGEDESLGKSLLKGVLPIIAQAASQAPQQREQLSQEEIIKRQQYQAELERRAALEQERQQNMRMEKERQRLLNSQQTILATNQEMKTKTIVETSEHNPTKLKGEPLMTTVKKAKADKEEILNLVIADIGQALLFRKDAKKTCHAALEKLAKQNITRKDILEIVSFDDIEQLAKKYNLPQEATPWLREFYNEIQATAGEKPRSTSKSERTINA